MSTAANTTIPHAAAEDRSPAAAMSTFFTSYECRSRAHCRTCQDPVRGQVFRQSIARSFGSLTPEWRCPHDRHGQKDGALPQPEAEADVAPVPVVAAPAPAAAAPASAGEFDFIYRRQEICLACGQFDARQGNCTVAGVTCGPCYRKVRVNRCPTGSW